MADGSIKIEVILDDSKMGGEIKKVEGRLGGIGNTAKRGIESVAQLAASLGLVGLAYKGIDMLKQSLDGAIDRYDTLNNFPRVMEQIGFDAQTSQKAIDKLSEGIQGLPTRLDEVASTAQSIAIMTGDLEGAVNTTLALNNAFLASGASTADAERGLQQYVQMLAKGEVDLQSWRTLQETMPFALRETAEAFGFTGQSATNDFYDALKNGDITMSEFNDKLIELDQAQGGFAETAQEASAGIRTAWTNMKTWFVMGVAGILEAIDELLGGTGSIEGAINGLKPIVQGSFSFIADRIRDVGSVIGFIKGKFNEWKPTIDSVLEAMQPLFEVFKETSENLREQLSPILETVTDLFFSLLPIITDLAMIVGGVLLAAFIVATTILNGVVNAVLPLVNAFLNLVDVVVNVANTIIAILKGDFDAALKYWEKAVESSIKFFENIWEGLVGFFMGIVDALVGWFNTLSEDAQEKVIEMVTNVSKFFTDLKNNAINKATELVQSVNNRFTNMKETIQNRVTEAKNQLANRFTEMVSNAKNKATEIVNTARQKFEEVKQNIQSKLTESVQVVSQKIGEMPGKVTEKVSDMISAGKDLIGGLISGIKQKGKDAIDAITGVVDGVINKAKSLLKIESPSRVFDDIGQDTIKGYERGIEKRQRHADKEITDLFKRIMSTTDKAFKSQLATINKNNAEIKKAETRASEDIYLIEKKAKEDKRKLTEAESIRIRRIEEDSAKKILNLQEKNNKIQRDVAKKQSAELLKIAEKYVEDKRKNGEMSIQDEIYFWNAMYRNAEKGSEQYELGLKNHQAAVKRLRQEVESINKEYNERIIAINNEYNNEVKRLNDEFEKEYDAHLNKMLNFAGLFDEFKRNHEITGQQLIRNLESQNKALADYDEVVNQLGSRISDENLITELKSLGVKAVGELQALNSLSDKQLEKYVTLYQQKFELARKHTDAEMQPMLDETNEKLEILKDDTSERLDELNKEWKKKIKQIVKSADKEFDSMRQVGIDAMQGLSNGMESMRGPLMAKAQSIASAIQRTIQSAFDIRSPSVWMRDFIGRNMMLGWIEGIDRERTAVLSKASQMAEWMQPEMKVTNRLRGVNAPIGHLLTPHNNVTSSTNSVTNTDQSVKQENHIEIHTHDSGAKEMERTLRRLKFGI